eukprot:CAMPEP_0202753180 /NCGR_PEP_ID=MMETSP1388-20130828/13385_1 /ASSEMBLY_ACC=CAM_ASM_000864 /TAXON_ID=37098 /ORGANISM="Isochrysis sp, Strain CCMP1244" /LENGTH=390 /DNA_ID=CAMNT_0049420915 /DNA_START=66 /DNA_END=1235 /DNA_ORIENTATION=-
MVGVLRSLGAPAPLGFLNGEWQRRCDYGGRAHYSKEAGAAGGAGAAAVELHIFFDGEGWAIGALGSGRGDAYAFAASDALHPNTVDKEAWRLRLAGASYQSSSFFSVQTEGPNSEAEPFSMEELGVDYFLRAPPKSRRVVWFVDPTSDKGTVLHSAAKSTAATGGGGRGQPGKRYCHLCHRCVSANNWVSQHLANTHRAAAPTGLLAISTGDEKTVEVRWVPPHAGGPVLPVTAYQLSVSFDEGASWSENLSPSFADKTAPSARVEIARLQALAPSGASSLRFAVAAVNVAGTGCKSDASPPVSLSGGVACAPKRLRHSSFTPPTIDLAAGTVHSSHAAAPFITSATISSGLFGGAVFGGFGGGSSSTTASPAKVRRVEAPPPPSRSPMP